METNVDPAPANVSTATSGRPPLAAGVLLGLGLGGFFDGIVLHQVLQWHHMLSSAGHPPHDLQNLRLNVWADGLFHMATWVFVAAGVLLLWRAARRPHAPWPWRALAGAFLLGFGAFNVVEGLVNHHALGLHHVNETVPRADWLAWDLGFLAWGALMVLIGAWLWRSARRSEAGSMPAAAVPADRVRSGSLR